MQRSKIDTDEYRKLRAVWAKKLAKSGFEDIEMLDPRTGMPGDRLKGVSPGDLRRSTHRIQYVRETERFYALCRSYLHTMDDEPALDRYVFARYAEGARATEIRAELNHRKRTRLVSLQKVRDTINKHVDRVRAQALEPEDDALEVDPIVWGGGPGE